MKKTNKKLIIIGGEGNGGVIASCIDDHRKKYNDFEWEVAGFLEDSGKFENIFGLPILGKTNDIKYFLEQDVYFMFAIHMVGKNKLNEKIYFKLNIPLDRFATIVHKTAFVATNVVLEPGVFVMSNAYIGHSSHVGYCSLVMANAVIGHNVIVGPLCHFTAGSMTSGYLSIGRVSSVAAGATILGGRNIGNYSVAGAHSLITKDIPDGEIHVGSPARFLRNTE